MTKIQRTTQKIFGGNAPSDDIAALGSFKAGIPIYTDDIASLQNEAYESGFGAALVANEAPFMEEQNSIPYILSKQLAYLYQEGIAEYDTETTYFIGSWVKGIINDKRIIYESLTDNNLGNPLTDQTHWQEIKFSGGTGSSLPLFTPMLFDHVLKEDEAVGWALQGSLITNTYPDAVAKIKELYQAGEDTTYREITCKRSQDGRYIADIAQKDAIEVLFTNTGIADFYVLDSSNNQFYLPKSKWFNQLTTDTSFVNNYNEDGLPNLKKDATGRSNMSLWSSGYNVEEWEGVIGRYPTNPSHSPNSGNYGQFQELLFDASKYNSKYGNSEYVQPPSSNKLLYYKVGNTIINEAQIDVGNVLSDLQLKANVDFNNITNKANTKIQDSSRKMLLLTNNYIDIAVGQILTADADGYATINCDNMHDTAQIAAYVFTPDGEIGIGNQHTAGANTNCQGAIFVPKGNKYKVWANGGSLKSARFYFCETYQGGS